MSSNTSRRSAAHQVRVSAADIAHNREHPEHVSNGDELRHRGKDGKPSYIATFTKGLPHDEKTGLVAEPNDVQLLIDGIDSGNPRDFRDTPLGDAKNVGERVLKPSEFRWKSDKAQTSGKDGKHVGVRAWESQGAGNTFDLEGPDAQAVTMPPAPALGSDELTAEMAEVYAQALLRDVPFTTLMCDPIGSKTEINKVDSVLEKLNALAWFSKDDCCRPTFERARSRGELSPHNAFRGITPGDNVGPYISQFLLAGNVGLGKAHEAKDGMIAYGAIRVDQRVRTAKPREDYMTTWNEWLDVQNGAKLGGLESYLNITKNESGFRFITTPRDLATYVHYDALYEAYLNACLIMLGLEIPFDPGLPFGDDDARDHQQGFAHFGGPHILSLVTEVATRALKAVRFQKFNIHRRCRPEVLAARMELATALKKDSPEIGKMFKDLDACGILDMVKTRNDQNNGKKGTAKDKNRYLLPMAFCEGSPMHPAYGAGHATVAGACVTILKAFFDHGHPLAVAGDPGKAFVSIENPDPTPANPEKYILKAIDVTRPVEVPPDEVEVPPEDHETNEKTMGCEPAILTVEGELNKLASNISIGRDWAGVHYFTDYIESIRMGEKIALGILEEQKITYGENFSMTVPLFDGGTVRI